jgi:hypothetical protein
MGKQFHNDKNDELSEISNAELIKIIDRIYVPPTEGIKVYEKAD